MGEQSRSIELNENEVHFKLLENIKTKLYEPWQNTLTSKFFGKRLIFNIWIIKLEPYGN